MLEQHKNSKLLLVNQKGSTDQLDNLEQLIQFELCHATKLSKLLCNQIVLRIHWITATCSLITVFYCWSRQQQDWYLRIMISFLCSLVIYLCISCFYSLNSDLIEQWPIVANIQLNNETGESMTNLIEDTKLANELARETRTIKHKEWLNRFLNEIWPRVCLSCKIDDLEKGISIGRFLCLNKFNLSKTQTPNIEQINLANKLDTTNGQVVILDLIATINWSTIDNENLISLSIYNLQFTISNLHSISTRLRLRIGLHYLNKESNNNLYKISITLLEQPVIQNYETSGAAYILYVFNLHHAFIYWMIEKFLIFPRTFVFMINKHSFDLDRLIEVIRDEHLIDLDLDDLKNLSLQHNEIDFFSDLITENDGQVHKKIQRSYKLSNASKTMDEKASLQAKSGELKEEIRAESKESVYRSKESNKDVQVNADKQVLNDSSENLQQLKGENKIMMFKKLMSISLRNKIAKHILHITVMYSLNIPLPKGLNTINNLSYFVRIKFGNFKFITNAHLLQEPVLYWMQNFMLAIDNLDAPVYLAVLVDQNQVNQNLNNIQIKKQIDLSSLDRNSEYLEKSYRGTEKRQSKLKECFEIKLTDNLEQFLNAHNLNGRLHTAEDEHSKCRLTLRFSVFDLEMPNRKVQQIPNETILNENLSNTGLPVGVFNLFISHVTGIEFISNLNRQSQEQLCRLSVATSSQRHMLCSLNIGVDQKFNQNCFLIIFNPAIEQVNFKIHFAISRENVKQPKENIVSPDSPAQQTFDLERKTTRFFTTLTTTNQLRQSIDEFASNVDQLDEQLRALASGNLRINVDRIRPQYEKIKLTGCLKDCHLHLYCCYSEIANYARLKRILDDRPVMPL